MASDATLLTAVEALLTGDLARGAQMYTFEGRSLQTYSLTELLKIRDQLTARIARASTGAFTKVRFQKER